MLPTWGPSSGLNALVGKAELVAPLTHSMIPEKGSNLTISATRSGSTETGLKHDPGGTGLIAFQSLADEAVFPGAMRVRNELSATEDFSNVAWTKINGGSGSAPTATSGFTDPNGGTGAWRIQADRGVTVGSGNYSVIRQTIVGGASKLKQTWIKSNTASSQNILVTGAGAANSITVTPTWAQYSAVQDTNNFDFGSQSTFNTTQAIDILVWHTQLVDVTGETDQTTPRPYVSVGALIRHENDPLYLTQPATTGHYTSTPNAVANQIAGPKTIIMRGLRLGSVAPAMYSILASTLAASDAGGFEILQDTGGSGKVMYIHRTGGSPRYLLSTAALSSVGITTTMRVGLAVTHDTEDGSVKFWYKLPTAGAIWTQLGNTVASTAGTTENLTTAFSVFGRSSAPTVYNNNAQVQRVELYSGVVTDLDAGTGGSLAQELYPHRDATTPTGTITSSTTGEVWTLNGASSVVRNQAYHGSMVDGVKCFPYDLDGNPIPASQMPGMTSWAAATNLNLHSQDASGWSPYPSAADALVAQTTSVASIIAGVNYLRNEEKATTNIHLDFPVYLIVSANTNYCVWRYVKAGEVTKCRLSWNTAGAASGVYADFNLTTGAEITHGTFGTGTYANSGIKEIRTGEYLIFVAGKLDAASTQGYHSLWTLNSAGSSSYLGVAGRGLYWIQAQVELGTYPTPGILTTTAAATRNAWVASYSGGDVANYKSIKCEFVRAVGVSSVGAVISLNDGTTNNRESFILTSATASIFVGVAGGSTQWDTVPANAYVPGGIAKAAWSAETNSVKMALNGTAPSPDTVATKPVVAKLELGCQAGATQLNGSMGGVVAWTRALSQSELNAVAT